jgi:hypothetical protein
VFGLLLFEGLQYALPRQRSASNNSDVTDACVQRVNEVHGGPFERNA